MSLVLSLFFGSLALMMLSNGLSSLRVPSSAFDEVSEMSPEGIRRSLRTSAAMVFGIGLVFALASAAIWVSRPLGLGIGSLPFLLGIVLYFTGGLEIISRLSVGD